MSSGEYRRSKRILELEERKAQKAVNKKKLDMIWGTTEGQLSQRQGWKVNHASSIKATNTGDAIAVSSNSPLPQTSALELLLDMLKRGDTFKIFSEPVNSAEVEGYDYVVKDPMDFATISRKLSRGKYKMLEEFEHDIFLVFSNAMLFNNSKTVYYRQARAIREVAKKLLTALRTDSSNFEIEFSMARQATDRWTKAEARFVNSSSCNQPKKVTTGKVLGSVDARKSDGLKLRTANKPRKSCPNENAASVSTILNAPVSTKPLVQNVSYKDSVLKFARGLGPVAQIVAQRKLDKCHYGSFIHGHVPLHHQCRACHHQQVPWTASPGSRMLPSVYQNPFGNPVMAFDKYPVCNHQHQQACCTISPGSGKLPSVYQNPFGSPVRVLRHNANAQRDDLDFGNTSTSNGGQPSMFDGMSFNDFLIYLLNL